MHPLHHKLTEQANLCFKSTSEVKRGNKKDMSMSIIGLTSSEPCRKYKETFTYHCEGMTQQDWASLRRIICNFLPNTKTSWIHYYEPIIQSFTLVNQQSSTSKPCPFKLGQLATNNHYKINLLLAGTTAQTLGEVMCDQVNKNAKIECSTYLTITCKGSIYANLRILWEQ